MGVYRMVRKTVSHDDVIKWKHFPRYWPFVRGIHRWPVNSPHRCQWRGVLMLSLIWAWINGWVNTCEAGDLRRHRAHYDVIAMRHIHTHSGTKCCQPVSRPSHLDNENPYTWKDAHYITVVLLMAWHPRLEVSSLWKSFFVLMVGMVENSCCTCFAKITTGCLVPRPKLNLRAGSRFAPSQPETPLQSKAISLMHGLSANLESALNFSCCIKSWNYITLV